MYTRIERENDAYVIYFILNEEEWWTTVPDLWIESGRVVERIDELRNEGREVIAAAIETALKDLKLINLKEE